jgi:hypothetical protein
MLHALLLATFTSLAENDDWILGKWQLIYDPDGSPADYLHFHVNGDVVSTGQAGTVKGIYLVSSDRVKAVLTVDEKDLILTFFFNEERNQLRIVTSDTGRESIYQKINEDQSPDNKR